MVCQRGFIEARSDKEPSKTDSLMTTVALDSAWQTTAEALVWPTSAQ